jgi:hypothetical protein
MGVKGQFVRADAGGHFAVAIERIHLVIFCRKSSVWRWRCAVLPLREDGDSRWGWRQSERRFPDIRREGIRLPKQGVPPSGVPSGCGMTT